MGKQIILNPADWQRLQVEVAQQGTMTVGLPNASPTLWGLPVVVSNHMPAGEVIVGDLSSTRHLAVNACDCCGTVGKKDQVPLCACYLNTAGLNPTLCPDCETCDFHHDGIPFGVCTKPKIVQDVVRTRARERARREQSGAE